MSKLLQAGIAIAAFGAIFVVPSVASAVSPELGETTASGETHVVPVGTSIIATTVTHSTTPTQIVMTTGVGSIVCGAATLTGAVTKNSGGIEGNITTAEFGGTHEKTTTGHCQGTGVLGEKLTVTPSHTTPFGLPWCVKVAGLEDRFEVRGSECAKVATPLTFTLHGSLTCGYEKASITGIYTTHPADAIVTIANQDFKRTPSSSIFCPSSGKLDMAFTLTTDAEEGKEGAALHIK